MCGICGIVVGAGGDAPDLDLLGRMTRRLHHRGPDGNGWYRDHRVALGHTRLAIVDTAGGAQPMTTGDGSVWVTFNGEIFNYVELRAQLQSLGHRFATASDTEVIVAAYAQWGTDCFARFNGQWALALWDRRAGHLVLSRDRLGVRPLYYVRTPRGLLFASEVKALFADPAVPRELDPDGLAEVFTFWSTVAPRTVFRGVGQLPPGHYAVLDLSAQDAAGAAAAGPVADGLRTTPYWSLDFPQRGLEPEQDVELNAAALRERIVTATRLRFERADVPVGAYLSGGLDSAVTAAVIARHTDAPLRTFSLRFSDDEFDEGRYQRLMSAALGTRHDEVVVSPGDVAEVFPDVVRHAENPLLRAAPAPLYLLSRLVRDHGYKVVVTGEGADEMLAGYDIFREARVRRFWARDPGSASRARAAELLYPWMARSPGRLPAFARTFFGRNLDPDDPALSHRPRWDSTGALTGLLTAPFGDRRDHRSDPVGELLGRMPATAQGWDPLSRDQWLETTTLLAGYLLASQGDRMLMANSVEGRFPFLDPDVVELAAGLPARHKLHGLEEKYLLKRAFADLVPEEIRRRPKQPYRAPDAASFFGGGTGAPGAPGAPGTPGAPEWFGDVTSERAVLAAGVFEPALVRGLLTKAGRAGGRGMSNTDNMRVLAVVSTQLLHATFVDGDGDGPLPAGLPAVPRPSVAVDLVREPALRRPARHARPTRTPFTQPAPTGV